jgi:hypothetical protein
MSEILLRILQIDDLHLIRIVCEGCGATVELPIKRLNSGGAIQKLACPAGCDNVYRVPDSHRSDALAKLAEAVRDVKEIKGCRIEFVVRESGKRTGPVSGNHQTGT